MSYRVEITADTLHELGGKVLALAIQLNATSSEVVTPLLPSRTVLLNVGGGGVTKSPVSDPIPLPPVIPQAEAVSEAAPEPVAEAAPEPVAEAAHSLTFDGDVAPITLQVVVTKGQTVVKDILSRFGVERASILTEAQWPEFISLLRAAL